jgi:tetratricopeptide (TPR) repeat protein
MSKIIRIFPVLFFAVQISYGQSNKELAQAKAKEAIRLEDESGKYDEAIALFTEAQKLDPENIDYPYEMAYSYAAKKEYKKASDILETLLNRKDVYGRVYQSLGNAYDYQGLPDKAIDTYRKGLKLFPNSGELYLELGNMELVKKDYDKAMGYYEDGIKNDPKFSSNYYWATKIFCSTEEEVWGMIYGEIFINLERNSKRTAEISKLLFDTYKSEIKFVGDTSMQVSFSKNNTISLDALKDPKNFKLPFGMGCYEILMSISVVGEKQIDLNSLDRIRTRFLDNYFKNKYYSKYPNVLFDYQKQVEDAGHLEAYNHWLLLKGDTDGFTQWQTANQPKWDAFVKWYGENMIQLDANHKFYRSQY